MQQQYVIIGANLAGGTAAITLKEEGFDGEIVLIGAEPHAPYERPPLSKEYLQGEKPFEDALLKPVNFYADHNIRTRFGTRAVRVDPRDQMIGLEGGERISYDKVLIATGVRNRKLRIPGADLEGIYDLRTVDDADRIRARSQSGSRAVLVGMGFIGSEVAASLRHHGVEVTVIEPFKTPLYRVLGEQIGRIFEALHRENGVQMYFEESVTAFEGTRHMQRVVTSAGRRIACDFVVVGVGVEPVTELMVDSGVKIENGILVDEYCQTNVEGIYAAGDVANHFHPLFGRRVRVEHWQNAIHQGRAAARNMLGKREPYSDVHWFWSDQYDCNVQYAGFHTGWDELVVRGSLEQRSAVAFYLQEQRVAAAVAFNRGRDVQRAMPLIKARVPVEPAVLRDESVDLRSLVPGARPVRTHQHRIVPHPVARPGEEEINMQVIETPVAGEVRHYQMLIGGEWVDAQSGRTFESINPYTGKVWALVPEAAEADVDAAVRAARSAFDEGPWGRMTGTERARLMRRLAAVLAENAERLATVESTDNGKLIREMQGQLKSLPEWYYYFAGAADKLEGETIPSDKSNFFVYTRREPVGVVGAITPWNSPLLLLSFKLAPALAAGCTFVVKPSEQTSASTLEFARLFAEAGFPPGVFNVITGYGPGTGGPLARHPGVDKVAFTGSTATGIRIMKDAADHLARVSLELGGKSPNIVFADADEDVVNGVVSGIFAASGQTCIAGSRLFVQAQLHDELVGRLADRARTIKLGNPLKIETEMGPVAFKEQQDKIKSYIAIAQEEGAHLVYGGKTPNDPELASGFFIEPTIFTQVDNRMRVAQEEIFGPVLSVIPFQTEEEVIRQANDTRYGLAAGIWTRDIRRAHRVAHALRAGTVWINSYRTLSFNTPFGGYKMSGMGSENGLEGVREYTQTKSVWVELSGQTRDPFKLG